MCVLLGLVFILFYSSPARCANYYSSLLVGYNGGLSYQLSGTIADFVKDSPLQVQLGFAYSRRDPGDAEDARRIFINDATNGDPEEKGWMWALRLDFLYPVNWLKMDNVYVYGGPRYAEFTGNFKYIGGNEDFDVTSQHWGIGSGLRKYFPINKNFDFALSGGFDYFFANDLKGHDTSYSPDGADRNPRKDYDYDDADDAIHQPKFEFRLMLGINYHF
jgi:hypothetical protein